MSAQSALKDIVFEFIQSRCPDAAKVPWTVAVSGGVDSMVLLHVLKQVADEMGVQCHAVHVHHGLRAAADDDSRFVQSACNRLGVPVDVRFIDVHSIPSDRSKGTEADARELRYHAILESVSEGLSEIGQQSPGSGVEKPPLPVVFLAHHADDQTETVLMRLVRGTSMHGLSGMRPVREWRGIRFVRPLLTVEKSRLMQYAAEHDISFVQDETNFDINYTRNFIRHEIVPRLAQIQPNVSQAVQRLTEVLQAEDEWLESISQEHFTRLVQQHKDALTVNLDSLLALVLPLQRRLIQIILYCLTPADWTFDHVDSILRLCGTSAPSATLHLPNQTLVRKAYNQLQFLRQRETSADGYQLFWRLDSETCCEIEAEQSHQSWLFQRTLWRGQDEQGLRLVSKYEAVFPYVTGLTIRPSVPGERMKVLGLHGSKKLQDLFVDAKIPRYLRSEWPCVYVEDELVWVPGVARSDAHLLAPHQQGWHVAAKPSNDYVGMQSSSEGPLARIARDNHKVEDTT